MTVFYDHQTFSIQNFGGISRYITELVKGISTKSTYQAYLPLLVSNNVHLREAGIVVKPFFTNQNFPKKQFIIYRLNELFNKVALYRNTYDLLHATYFDPYFIPYLQDKPFVITIHDMTFEKLGNQFNELRGDNTIIKQKKLLAEKATRIIAVSESTKRDIIEILNINPTKIDVVYHGSSFVPKVGDQSDSTDSYLLFVGNRGHYKNFLRFLQASAPILKQYELTLVCAGGGDFSISEQKAIQLLGISSHVKQYSITSDETLRGLYESALAFVFPSLYEGFGIPILEAFACNCPCVLSETSSLPEVAGSAAIYFDPACEESISSTIELIVTDRELRKQLIIRGKERLAHFSWTYTVHETLNVYEKCFRT